MIMRYDTNYYNGREIEAVEDGKYVSYEDHIKLIELLDSYIGQHKEEIYDLQQLLTTLKDKDKDKDKQLLKTIMKLKYNKMVAFRDFILCDYEHESKTMFRLHEYIKGYKFACVNYEEFSYDEFFCRNEYMRKGCEDALAEIMLAFETFDRKQQEK